MFTKIEAINFRCLRDVEQELRPFQVLVGPNASGKTTFLAIFSFLSRLMKEDLESAVQEVAETFTDLSWNRSGEDVQLALEAEVPEKYRASEELSIIRYEISIGGSKSQDLLLDSDVQILSERVIFKSSESEDTVAHQYEFFPREKRSYRDSLMTPKGKRGIKSIINSEGGNAKYYEEGSRIGNTPAWFPSFKFSTKKSTLSYLPDDMEKFPATSWLKSQIMDGIQNVVLNSQTIRRASPPGQKNRFKTDGSNLPWVIEYLFSEYPKEFSKWLEHVKTALPDVDGIRTVKREEDNHLILYVKYKNGVEVPSWVVSDGTLRLLALTVIAFLPNLEGTFMIEEPENGIHPPAIECVLDSLKSVYGAQVLVASHSTTLLAAIKPKEVLCFSKDSIGATDIVYGEEHPALVEWQSSISLGDMLATGILG